MKIKFKNLKAALSTLVLLMPQCSFVGAHSDKKLIYDFVESLSIASEAVTIKLPGNMDLQHDVSQVSHNGTDASVLVFTSNAKFKEKLTYQHQPTNTADETGHVAKIKQELCSNYDTVKQHSKKTKRFKYKGITHHLIQMTFSCYGEKGPTAVTVVSVSDNTGQVTVSAQVQHPSLKKAVTQSKQLAKKGLSTRKDSSGPSLWVILGIGALVYAMLIVHHPLAGINEAFLSKLPGLAGAITPIGVPL